jgi:hypothetical protein
MLFNQIDCISNTAKHLLHHLGLAQLILQGVQILMRQLGIVRTTALIVSRRFVANVQERIS